MFKCNQPLSSGNAIQRSKYPQQYKIQNADVQPRYGQDMHRTGFGIGVEQFIIKPIGDSEHKRGGDGLLMVSVNITIQRLLRPLPPAVGQVEHRIARLMTQFEHIGSPDKVLMINVLQGQVRFVVELPGIARGFGLTGLTVF